MNRWIRAGSAAVALAAAFAPTANAGTATVTFSSVGDKTYRVPAGAGPIQVRLVGGNGEPGNALSQPAPGGIGGRVIGNVNVAPGTTLTARIGGGGAAGVMPGFPLGGGAGGHMAAVLVGPDVQAVAGGGGGGGGCAFMGGPGGNWGSPGANGSSPSGLNALGGGAGTQSAGGQGGAGHGNGQRGGDGAAWAGGAGGGGGGSSYSGGGLFSLLSMTTSTENVGAYVRFTYEESVAPSLSLNVAPVNPPTLGGTAGTDTGDDATVTLEINPGNYTVIAPVGAGGAFSVPTWSTLPDGQYTITATQSDNAGNTATDTQTFTIATQAPDTTAPSCGSLVVRRGARDEADVTITDSESGIAEIRNFTVTNGTTVIPPFTPGDKTLTVTVHKDVQGVLTRFSFDVVDVAGNIRHCR